METRRLNEALIVIEGPDGFRLEERRPADWARAVAQLFNAQSALVGGIYEARVEETD